MRNQERANSYNFVHIVHSQERKEEAKRGPINEYVKFSTLHRLLPFKKMEAQQTEMSKTHAGSAMNIFLTVLGCEGSLEIPVALAGGRVPLEFVGLVNPVDRDIF